MNDDKPLKELCEHEFVGLADTDKFYNYSQCRKCGIKYYIQKGLASIFKNESVEYKPLDEEAITDEKLEDWAITDEKLEDWVFDGYERNEKNLERLKVAKVVRDRILYSSPSTG